MMNKKLLALSLGIAFTSLYGCNATKTDKTESTAVEASQSNDSDKSGGASLPDTALIAKVPTLSYDKRYDQSNASILENHFRYGIAPITEIKSNLDEMYNKLLSASGSSIKLPSSITVLNSQSYADNSGVDGNIFISRVILTDAQNDDEIAFAVAHEMAHLILQHHQSDKVKDVIGTITGAIEQMEALSQKKNKTAKKSDTKVKIKLANMIYDKVINSAWVRSQENEADLLAMDIMSKAGYNVANVNHISKFFDRLDTYEAEMAKKNTIQNIMSSLQSAFSSQDEEQPKSEQKKSSGPLGVLGASLGGSGMVGGLLSGKTDPDALKQTAVLALISGALEGLKEDHPTPADRRNNVTAYVNKFYATTELKKAKKDLHKVIQANQEAFTAYANIAKLSADTLEQNTSLLSSLPKKYETLPVVEFYSAVSKGKSNPDVKALEKVVANTKIILPPAEAYQTLAKAYRESGDTNKSQTVLTKLKNDYGNGEFLKPYLTLE